MFVERLVRLALLCAFLLVQGGATACPMIAPVADHSEHDAPAHAHEAHAQHGESDESTTTPQTDGSACALAMTCGGVALPVLHHTGITTQPADVPANGAMPLAIDAPTPTVDRPPPKALA